MKTYIKLSLLLSILTFGLSAQITSLPGVSLNGNNTFTGTQTIGTTVIGTTTGIMTTSAYDAYGDSITLGTGASISANSYASLTGAAFGRTTTNHGVGGYTAADVADSVYATSVEAATFHLYSLLIGQNDMGGYGVGTAGLTTFQNIVAAEVAWLALPAGSKTLGQSSAVTYVGSWTNNSTMWAGTLGKVSNTNGDTATFSFFGQTLYIGSVYSNGNGGSFSVTIDGVNYGTFNCFGPASVVSSFSRTYAPFLIRIPALSHITHSATITVTSATSTSNKVYLDWTAENTGVLYRGAPAVFASGPLRYYNSTGEVTNDTYSTLIRQGVNMLAADGLQVNYVEASSYLDPVADFSADHVHPNDQGHGHLRDAFVATMVPRQTHNSFIGQPLVIPDYLNNWMGFGIRPQTNVHIGGPENGSYSTVAITDTLHTGTSAVVGLALLDSAGTRVGFLRSAIDLTLSNTSTGNIVLNSASGSVLVNTAGLLTAVFGVTTNVIGGRGWLKLTNPGSDAYGAGIQLLSNSNGKDGRLWMDGSGNLSITNTNTGANNYWDSPGTWNWRVFNGSNVMTLSAAGALSTTSTVTVGAGGLANRGICWKPDGKTLGYCSTVVAADGSCTCN